MKKSLQSWSHYRRLKKSLQQQIKDELESAESDDSQSPDLEKRVKRINDLQDLIQAAHVASPFRKLEKFVVLGALVIVLIGVSFLVFRRVSETDIEAHFILTEVTFVLAQDSPVLQPMNVSDVQVFDVKSITASAQKVLSLDASEGGVARVSSAAKRPKENSKTGEITLPGIVLPKGTAVSVKGSSNNDRFRLAFSPPQGATEPLVLDMTGRGPVDIHLVGDYANQSASADMDSPYPIRVVPLSHEFSLDFALPAGASVELLPQIPISQTSFTQEEAESEARQISAIHSGYLVRTELGNEKLELRPFEPFKVLGCTWEESKRCLRLRRLTMSKTGIEAQFDGNVTGLKTGPVGAERELMPSLLEWINSNHHIKLLWTAILFGSGLILGLIRWMTKST